MARTGHPEEDCHEKRTDTTVGMGTSQALLHTVKTVNCKNTPELRHRVRVTSSKENPSCPFGAKNSA